METCVLSKKNYWRKASRLEDSGHLWANREQWCGQKSLVSCLWPCFQTHAAGQVVGSIALFAALPQHGFAVKSVASAQRNRKLIWFMVSDLIYLTSLAGDVRSQGLIFLPIVRTALSTVGWFDFWAVFGQTSHREKRWWWHSMHIWHRHLIEYYWTIYTCKTFHSLNGPKVVML